MENIRKWLKIRGYSEGSVADNLTRYFKRKGYKTKLGCNSFSVQLYRSHVAKPVDKVDPHILEFFQKTYKLKKSFIEDNVYFDVNDIDFYYEKLSGHHL